MWSTGESTTTSSESLLPERLRRRSPWDRVATPTSALTVTRNPSVRRPIPDCIARYLPSTIGGFGPIPLKVRQAKPGGVGSHVKENTTEDF